MYKHIELCMIISFCNVSNASIELRHLEFNYLLKKMFHA